MEEPKILNNRYQLGAKIGHGPMATVYEATDLENDRQVAVKIFQSRFLTDPNFAIRFREHLKIIVELDHDNMATILDYGRADGVYYLAMEMLPGLTLRTVIAEQGALSAAHAVHISQQICAGVQEIHQQGLVHRDLKPENILLLPDGQVKITDVGLTSLLSETGLSKTDVMVNGVGYMSPEQARGQAVGPPSDIYNIGILLYEMLTERLPFESSDAWQVVKMHAQDIPPSTHDINPKVPIGLSRIVDRALQKEPSGRFASAAEMEVALAELPQSEGFWWHRLPAPISSKEGSNLLAFLAGFRQQAPVQLRRWGAAIAARMKRTSLSRRELVAYYFASFLIAFAILFSISGLMLDDASQVTIDDASHQSMIDAHEFNDRRDQPPKESVLPWALTSTVSRSLNNGQEKQAVDSGANVSEGSASASPAGATGGGAPVKEQGGGEKGGQAKGKDKQGGKGNGKGNDKGKKKGQDNKGKGNNNGKGKGAGGKKK